MYRLLRTWLPMLVLSFSAPALAEGTPEDSSSFGLSFLREHNFSREEARERLKQLLDYWGRTYGVQRRWNGDTARITGHIMGIPVNAQLTVKDHEVEAVASDPGFFFRGAAISYIDHKLRKYLDPNYQDS